MPRGTILATVGLEGDLFVGAVAMEAEEVALAIDRLRIAEARVPMNGSIACVLGRADGADGELEAEAARKGGARYFPEGSRRRGEARRSATP